MKRDWTMPWVTDVEAFRLAVKFDLVFSEHLPQDRSVGIWNAADLWESRLGKLPGRTTLEVTFWGDYDDVDEDGRHVGPRTHGWSVEDLLQTDDRVDGDSLDDLAKELERRGLHPGA
jgi:hypothetical protein